jgi:hypothetical protein
MKEDLMVRSVGGLRPPFFSAKNADAKHRLCARERVSNHAEDLATAAFVSSAWFETPRMKDARLLTMRSFFIDT